MHSIATRPILDLCDRSARRTGERVSLRWWEQARLDLEGGNKMAEVAEADSYREELIGEEEGITLELRRVGIEVRGTK